MKRHNRILLTTVILLGVLAAAVLALGKGWVENRIKAALVEQGLEGIAFSVDTLGWRGITFKEISLGEGVPVTLDRLTVDYSVLELLNRQVRELRIDNISFREGQAEIEADNLLLRFEQAPQDSWQGSWSVESLSIEKAPLPIPALAGGGTFAAQQGKVDIKGDFKNAGNTHRASLAAHYDADDKTGSGLTVVSASLPWNGGTLATHNAFFPFNRTHDIALTLEVQRVPLDALMKAVTGERATASGVVSGTVPVVFTPERDILFNTGSLKAEEPGTIALSPEALPGDNEQVGLVREILKDFHYRELSMGMNSGKDKKLSILLQLSGNNPAVYNGREIKLNVNLTGDVLSLLKQSILPIADPKQLLRQNENEK